MRKFLKQLHMGEAVPLTLLFLFILKGLQGRWIWGQGDSASYVDFLTLRTSKIPLVSNFTLSPWNILSAHGYLHDTPAQFCAQDFQNIYSGVSNFHWHAYLFTFAAWPLSRLFFFSSPITFSLALESLSYAFGLFLIIKFLLRKKIPILYILVLSFVLLSSPLFIRSLLGQPYLDRLSFGPLIGFILYRLANKVVSWKEQRINLLYIVLIMSINERASLTVGLLSICLLLAQLKTFRLNIQDIYCLSASSIPIFWFIYWKNNFATSDYYDNVNLKAAISNFRLLFTPLRSSNFLIYLVIAIPFLFIILIGSLRYFIIALIFLVPNLVVNIGGAELSGYYTHYHAMYLPILFALSTVSTADLFLKKRHSKKNRWMAASLLGFSLLLSLVAIDQTSQNSSTVIKFTKNSGELATSLGLYDPPNYKVREMAYTNFFNSLKFIPVSQSISAPEYLFPGLLRAGFKDINYFPVGLGHSKVLIIPFTSSASLTPDISIYGLMPKNLINEAGGCFLNRIDAAYKLKRLLQFQGTNYGIYFLK